MASSVLIIGAGAAGLMAARDLTARGHFVTVLEARERTGGRIHTLYSAAFSVPVETGAEFIHGNLPVTIALLQQAGIGYHPIAGKMVEVRNGRWNRQRNMVEGWDTLMKHLASLEEDMTVRDFLDQHFPGDRYTDLRQSVQRFAEGYDGADINKASILSLRDEWEKEDDDQYHIEGGYGLLIDYLASVCVQQGGAIHLNTPVKQIRWQAGKVEAESADGRLFLADKVIITIPLGMWQQPGAAGSIQFTPAIEERRQAFQEIGFSAVIKANLEFKQPFWVEYEKELGFLFSEEILPTWWTQLPHQAPLLTGWVNGPQAASFVQVGKEKVLQYAVYSLAGIFGLPVLFLEREMIDSQITDWGVDPYALGAYSYDMLSSKQARRLLQQPVADTLYFAGEALYEGAHPGTVEAALISGRDAAKKI
jgi:monoamine oxidase